MSRMNLGSLCLIILALMSKFGLGSPSSGNSLLSNPLDIKINIGQTASFDVFLEKQPTDSIWVTLECENPPCSTFNHESLSFQLTPENYKVNVNFTALRPGHDVIIFEPLPSNFTNITNLCTDWAFVRIRVGRSHGWITLGAIFGWSYFFVWSLSFWPQNFTNFRRKSVVGLNFDFTLLHFSGFLYYSIFNIGLYFSSAVREDYEKKYPRSEIPLELNDVVYSLHALFTTSITWIQCFIYEKGDQKLALYSKLFQIITWSVGGILMILAFFHTITWLTFIYYFSYIKLVVTSIKYLPQMWFNFKRKSTAGWTIYMIWLDISGGSLSMLQMITVAFTYDDWRTLIGNLPKFGLGLASVFYDMIFLLQHFVLYRHPKIETKPKQNDG